MVAADVGPAEIGHECLPTRDALDPGLAAQVARPALGERHEFVAGGSGRRGHDGTFWYGGAQCGMCPSSGERG